MNESQLHDIICKSKPEVAEYIKVHTPTGEAFPRYKNLLSALKQGLDFYIDRKQYQPLRMKLKEYPDIGISLSTLNRIDFWQSRR